MKYLASVSLIVVGIIHLIPVTGVLGPAALAELYGVTVTDQNLILMLRHRAILFGLLGMFLIVAAFKPDWFLPAWMAGVISVVSFLVLAWGSRSLNPSVSQVFKADVVALAVLIVGMVAHIGSRMGPVEPR